MFSIIKDCGQTLEDYLLKNVQNGVDVFEFRDLMARFNTNVISSVAFGIENDCINEPDHIFRKMGAKVFETSLSNGVRGMVAFLVPNLFHKIKLRILARDIEDFIFSIVKQTVNYREQNNISRNDFMQLLLQLKNQGYLSVDKNNEEQTEKTEAPEDHKKLSMDQLAANVFLFFAAGFETSSSTLSFCLFELARNPEIQKKIQEEVDKVFTSDEITYDMLSDLKYVECCVDETLRKYPIVPTHFRTATRDYKVADSNLTIPKDTAVMIPVLGFHRDPEIYENPMEFKPERFTNSSHGNGKSKGTFYTPFGDGPRNCIGMRLGKLTTKLGLALIMRKFNLELSDKEMCDKELEFHPNQFVLTPLKPFNIKITKR
jgi:cytochrome P450 family 6